ncbi:MAG: peptide chain release factor-like protein [Methylococcales bacterium]
MKEIHLTKKDFKIDWFSGQGAGGQHRNKHQNCCRITHIKTGLCAQGTNHRERVANQRDAFNRLAKLVIAHLNQEKEHVDQRPVEVIRNYHAVRNEVHDKSSGLRSEYRHVVLHADLSEMIDARRKSMGGNME